MTVLLIATFAAYLWTLIIFGGPELTVLDVFVTPVALVLYIAINLQLELFNFIFGREFVICE